jgi:ribosomal-protein-alanine N-acetyltransferase
MQEILAHPPTIDTARLTLRPLTMADDAAIYAYGSDPEVTKYVLFETHNSIEDTKIFLQATLEQYSNNEPTSLGIELKENRELIGSIGYLNWNEAHKRIEIGYALSRDFWNNGYVSEAAKGLIDHLFSHSDLIRIEARCRAENFASARVMEKAGMKFEGLLRKQIFSKGEHHDMKMYSIIRDEWQREDHH